MQTDSRSSHRLIWNYLLLMWTMFLDVNERLTAENVCSEICDVDVPLPIPRYDLAEKQWTVLVQISRIPALAWSLMM